MIRASDNPRSRVLPADLVAVQPWEPNVKKHDRGLLRHRQPRPLPVVSHGHRVAAQPEQHGQALGRHRGCRPPPECVADPRRTLRVAPRPDAVRRPPPRGEGEGGRRTRSLPAPHSSLRCSPVKLGEPLDEGQPDPQPLLRGVLGVSRLREKVEDERKRFEVMPIPWSLTVRTAFAPRHAPTARSVPTRPDTWPRC